MDIKLLDSMSLIYFFNIICSWYKSSNQIYGSILVLSTLFIYSYASCYFYEDNHSVFYASSEWLVFLDINVHRGDMSLKPQVWETESPWTKPRRCWRDSSEILDQLYHHNKWQWTLSPQAMAGKKILQHCPSAEDSRLLSPLKDWLF